MACFLFYGEDLYSIREKVNFWKDEFAKKHGGEVNIEELSDENITVDALRNAISTMPFLGEKRLVLVRNLILQNQSRGKKKERNEEETEDKTEDEDAEATGAETPKKIAGILESCPDFCVCVFIEEGMPDQRTTLFKKLQKCAEVTEFKLKSGGALISWIFGYCKKIGAQIEEPAALFLSELAGGNLYRMENEIQKLAHYAVSRPITKNDIDLLVDTKFDISIFRLTDSLGNGNAKMSLKILHQLLETDETLHRILYMIVRQFRIIMQAKELNDQGLRKAAIAAKIGEKPYVCGIAMAQAHNFSFEKLRTIYQALLKIDTQLKTGGIRILTGDNREFVMAVDKFIVDTCRNS